MFASISRPEIGLEPHETYTTFIPRLEQMLSRGQADIVILSLSSKDPRSQYTRSYFHHGPSKELCRKADIEGSSRNMGLFWVF